ncbi:hypothetical protein, partial [Frankia tisae]|uniref:hypothetical protein n=2 Tax=Frankia tisae TaxID=2950104 RepID=UPI0021BF6B08
GVRRGSGEKLVRAVGMGGFLRHTGWGVVGRGYADDMETFGAVVIALLLLLIPVILVNGALGWAYVRSAPLRAANAVQAGRDERART